MNLQSDDNLHRLTEANITAWLEGQAAAAQGLGEESNPHSIRSGLNAQWRGGFASWKKHLGATRTRQADATRRVINRLNRPKPGLIARALKLIGWN